MFNKLAIIGTAVVLVLLLGTVADAAPGLCVTKPPVIGPNNTGPLIDPPAKKGQWFMDIRTGAEQVRSCEFYDNVYGHGGGWADCYAIEGYIVALWFDANNNIYAFDMDVCITNDMPGYDLNWRDGDNQHDSSSSARSAMIRLASRFACSASVAVHTSRQNSI